MVDGDSSRVSQRDLYDELTAIRQEMQEGFTLLRDEMRRTYAISAVCEQKHVAVEDTIRAAVAVGSDDRENLWGAHRTNAKDIADLTKKVYAGVGVCAVLAVVAPIVVKVLMP